MKKNIISIVTGMVLGPIAVLLFFDGHFDVACQICLVAGILAGAFVGSLVSVGLKKSLYFFGGLIAGALSGAVVGFCIEIITCMLDSRVFLYFHIIPMHGEADGWGTLGVMIFMPILGAVSGAINAVLGLKRRPFAGTVNIFVSEQSKQSKCGQKGTVPFSPTTASRRCPRKSGQSPFLRVFDWIRSKIGAACMGVLILTPFALMFTQQMNLLRAIYLSIAIMITGALAGLVGRFVGKLWKAKLAPHLLERDALIQ